MFISTRQFPPPWQSPSTGAAQPPLITVEFYTRFSGRSHWNEWILLCRNTREISQERLLATRHVLNCHFQHCLVCSSSPEVSGGCVSVQGEKYYTRSSSLHFLKNPFQLWAYIFKTYNWQWFSSHIFMRNQSIIAREESWLLIFCCCVNTLLAAVHRPITVGYLELSWFIPIDFSWIELDSGHERRLNWFANRAALWAKNRCGSSCRRGQLVSGHFPAGFAVQLQRSVCKQLLFASEKYGSLGLGLSEACPALDWEHKVRWQPQQPLLAPLLRWWYNLALFPASRD